jgi:hypothetical protein
LAALLLNQRVFRQHQQVFQVIAQPRGQRFRGGRFRVDRNGRRLRGDRHGEEAHDGPADQHHQHQREHHDIGIAQHRMDIVEHAIEQETLPDHNEESDRQKGGGRPFEKFPALRPLGRKLPFRAVLGGLVRARYRLGLFSGHVAYPPCF